MQENFLNEIVLQSGIFFSQRSSILNSLGKPDNVVKSTIFKGFC